MPRAPSYSPSDLLLFTHVLDQIAFEAGGLDEAMRAKVGLRITMGAAAGLSSVADLAAYAREAVNGSPAPTRPASSQLSCAPGAAECSVSAD